jgi:hypothetical protein
LIIILAAIFVPQFQKLIFASDAEATLSDKLSIKGKMFATICLAIVAAMVFVFYLDKSEQGPIPEQDPITIGNVVDLLNDSFDLKYELRGDQIQGKYEANKDTTKTIIIGKLNSTPERILDSKKSSTKSNWYVTDEDFTIGQLKHEVNLNNYERLVLDTTGYNYKNGTTYSVGDGRFRFRIDSVVGVGLKKDSYEYYLSFGEKQDDEKILWKNLSEPIPKSINGKIKPINRKKLWQQNWKNDYIVDIGLGIPTSYDIQKPNSGVDLLNIRVSEIKFK